MPRLPRRELLPQHGFFHITARGVAEEAIFRDDADRVVFLALLGGTVGRFHWRSHSFCLMSTHYHLVIEAQRALLSAGLHRLNGIYAQHFNRRHGRRGHLFADRFAAWLIESEEHLYAACRYLLLNPVRAGLCHDPAAYLWSGSRYGKIL
ncbi:MAG: transposase [Thermoleophilia bacterium]|nr:transposase [Thermoleophilia bacterium]